jgi:hypothetical protein
MQRELKYEPTDFFVDFKDEGEVSDLDLEESLDMLSVDDPTDIKSRNSVLSSLNQKRSRQSQLGNAPGLV